MKFFIVINTFCPLGKLSYLKDAPIQYLYKVENKESENQTFQLLSLMLLEQKKSLNLHFSEKNLIEFEKNSLYFFMKLNKSSIYNAIFAILRLIKKIKIKTENNLTQLINQYTEKISKKKNLKNFTCLLGLKSLFQIATEVDQELLKSSSLFLIKKFLFKNFCT